MDEEKFQVGTRVREKSTGLEMNIVEMMGIYDADKLENYFSGRVLCTYYELNKSSNSFKELNVSDLEIVED